MTSQTLADPLPPALRVVPGHDPLVRELYATKKINDGELVKLHEAPRHGGTR